MTLGVTVTTQSSCRATGAKYRRTPSAHCTQCDKRVTRCRHVTPYFDNGYAPCKCATHTFRQDQARTPCIMAEYLDGKRPGQMQSNGSGAGTHWSWPDGRPIVRCMNCGAQWEELFIGDYIKAGRP